MRTHTLAGFSRCKFPKIKFLIGIFAGLIACFLSSPGFGQSPPLGPPNVTVDTDSIEARFLTGVVDAQVQDSLTTINADLKKKTFAGISASVSEMPLQVWAPYRLPTTYTNAPNEWYVKLPVTVGIDVSIPGPDHQVFIPIDLNITCANWNTGRGVLTVNVQPGPPSFEGGGWTNDTPLVAVNDEVNAYIKSLFSIPTATQVALGTAKCNGLGVTPPAAGADPTTAEIDYSRPATGPRMPIGVTVSPTLTVTFTGLKRLVAHDTTGSILYNPTENIVLQVYADFTDRASQVLTMHENDQVALNLAPVVINSPLLDPLVVIANITQQTQGNEEDSSFAVWPQSMNYSPGTHTLTVTKTYSMAPPSLPGINPEGPNKPVFVTIPGYELTYTVQYQNALVNKPEAPTTKPGPKPVSTPPAMANPHQ